MTDQPILLSLTPPRHSVITPAGQVEMLSAMAHVRRATARGVALEIAGEAGHVRFLARAANAAAATQVEMVVSGYYPQGTVLALESQADDPARRRADEGALAVELRLRRGSELPLRMPLRDEASVQLLRVIGVLRTLPSGMRGLCQLILWPAPRRWGRDVERWVQQERLRGAAQVRTAMVGLPTGLITGPVLVVLAGIAGYHAYQAHNVMHLAALGVALIGAGALGAARLSVFAPDPPPDPDLVERKLATPAFTARLRLLVAGGDDAKRHKALDALVAAYGGYEEPRGNSFIARPCAPAHLAAITTIGGPRLWRPWPILSAAEVAGLYHLPTEEIDVPGLARTGPRTLLPTAPALTRGTPVGTVTLGVHSELVRIPHAAHEANVIVLGATGTGKSTFLQHYAHDAVTREGVQLVVIDPDSTLVSDMVGWLPDAQKRRAIVIDFGHPERAVGVNLLDAYTGRRTDQIIDSLVQAWARFYAEAWGPRLEDLIRYACATVLAANRTRLRYHQLTLLDIKPLLQISAFRDEIVRQADDVKLAAYWRDDYLGMPRTERLNAIKPVLTRINRFLLNDAARAVVGQPASSIDIPSLLDSGVPLFIDAAAHTVGEETAALLDAVLLNIIHDAVCERPARERQVLIVVDEFHHAPALWDEYLPRIRKYGGSYVLAAQGIATVDRVRRDLHKVVVGNTGAHVVFRTPDPDEAGYLAAVLDNTVMAEDIQTLGVRQCYIKTSDATGPLPVVSAMLPPPPQSSGGTVRLIAAACARRYGRPIVDVMAARDRWMTELFYAASEVRRRPPENADDAASQTTRAPSAQVAAAQEGGDRRPSTGPTMGPGSQPLLGLPVTRVSAKDATRPRRQRRRKGVAMPQPHAAAAYTQADLGSPDPLPLPAADPSQALQLPLLPGSDGA